MESRFCRYELRTTDVGAARTFYTELFGEEFWGDGIDAVPLPEQAAARGAPPHWLGHIGVDDVEETTRRFVAAGAEQLGPTRLPDGASQAVLRDPFGAIVALRSIETAPRGDRVVWHILHAPDEARAFALYASLFGWKPIEALDLGPELGRHQTFDWHGSGRAVGSAASTAGLPHVHPQWLFFFRTDDLQQSLAKVRARGGITLPAIRTTSGDLVAPCDDAEGAAFGLYQFASR